MHSIALSCQHQTGVAWKIIQRMRDQGAALPQAQLVGLLGKTVSQSTISRALSSLQKQGIVQKTGKTKGAMFELSPQALYWATPARQRPPVSFQPERISAYIPNNTRWLPDDVQAAFADVGGSPDSPLQASTYTQAISERFLIDLSWASARLEGNTYSWLDTEILIKYGEAAEGREALETTMILNHKRAIGLLLDQATGTSIHPDTVAQVHSHLLRGLLSPEALGQIRRHEVQISASSYRPTSDRALLQRTHHELLWKAEQIQDPYEASFFLSAGLAYLQSFEDGNKRLGRLMGNLPLLRAGLPPLSYMEISKREYIQGLLDFYELGETRLLAETLLASYRRTAPSYTTGVLSQRIPHRLEFQERAWIEARVRQSLQASAGHPVAPIPSPRQSLSETDASWLEEHVREVVAHLSPVNAPAWQVPPELLEAHLQNQTPIAPVSIPRPKPR